MAQAHEVKGVTTKRMVPVITPKPTNPARKHMSHDEAVKDNARMKKASEAAEIARKKVMGEDQAEPEPVKPEAPKESDLRAKLREVEEKLKLDPENRGLKIQRGKLNKAIHDAEV